MDDLVKAGEMIVQGTDPSKRSPFFDSHQRWVSLNGPKGLSLEDDDLSTVVRSFRKVALYSKIPQFAAELMGLTSTDSSSNNNQNSQDNKEKGTNLRLLRDVFLAKGLESPKSCQWHVDDPSFWPESYQSTGGEGINAWIAMADMPQGGSMGLLPGSHKAPGDTAPTEQSDKTTIVEGKHSKNNWKESSTESSPAKSMFATKSCTKSWNTLEYTPN